MDFIWNRITDWLKEILVGGIMGNLQGLFDQVNTQVAGIAGQVGTTPQAWNGGVYSMIRSLSDQVILPIAGVILAIVMTMELLQLVMEKNNMHDFETWVFFKWMFKTFCAVMIVTNTWDIVMGVFDLAQSVVNAAAGVISSDTSLELGEVVANLEARLMEMEIGAAAGALVPESVRRGHDERADHLHLCGDLRPHGGDLHRHFPCAAAPWLP